MYLKGTVVVQAGQGASPAAEKGLHGVEICLLAAELGQVVEVEYPGLAFVAPHWGEAEGEGGAPSGHGIAAVLDKWDGERERLTQGTPAWVCGVQQSQAWDAHGP